MLTESTHKVEVVPVVLEKHPNADSLSVVKVFGYTVVVRTEDWDYRTRGAYVPPDSLVPVSHRAFTFLADQANSEGYARIKAKKFRGVQSFGLLVPVEYEQGVGDDVTALYGVKHYEPPMKGFGGQSGLHLGGEESPAPPGVQTNKYDIEAGRRYADQVFVKDEPVYVSEKIHGANCRVVYAGGQMFVGSRTQWKKEYPDYSHVTHEYLLNKGMDDEAKRQTIIDKVSKKNGGRCDWYKVLDKHPELRRFCSENPGVVLYGEMYGAVQDLTYGHKPGEVSFAAFDILGQDGQFFSAMSFLANVEGYGLPVVPTYGFRPYDFDDVCRLAEGPSFVPEANHVREGVVVKPLHERWHPTIGRVVLKWVGAGYLERKG